MRKPHGPYLRLFQGSKGEYSLHVADHEKAPTRFAFRIPKDAEQSDRIYVVEVFGRSDSGVQNPQDEELVSKGYLAVATEQHLKVVEVVKPEVPPYEILVFQIE